MPATPFDRTAQGYDLEFTETQVGRMQRAVTHRFLREWIKENRPKTALELNCGTGEDAVFLAKQGLEVTATDLSLEMVRVTAQKVQHIQSAPGKPPVPPVRVLQSGIQGIETAVPGEKFDLVWSNFGGFNCLTADEVRGSAAALRGLLNDNGLLVLVVMGRFCAWESLYFSAKLRFGKAFRRRKKGAVQARLADGIFQDTYYYSPAQVETMMGPHFQVEKRMAVGAYLPPSYLDAFFSRRPKLLSTMERWESAAYGKPFPAQFADHFLVAFRPR